MQMSLVDYLKQLSQAQPQVDSTPLSPEPAYPSDKVDPSVVPDAPAAPAPQGAVPAFQPAPDLGTHYSLMKRILHGAQGAVNAAGQALAPIPSAQAATMSPEDIRAARSQALISAGTNILARTPGADGTAPSFLQSLAGGIQAGQRGSQNFAARVQQANAAEAQRQQQEDDNQAEQVKADALAKQNAQIQAGRNQLPDLMTPQPTDDPAGLAMEMRLQKALGVAVSSGDEKGAAIIQRELASLNKKQQAANRPGAGIFKYFPTRDGIQKVNTITGQAELITVNQADLESRAQRQQGLGMQSEGLDLATDKVFAPIAKPFETAAAAYRNFDQMAQQAANSPAVQHAMIVAYIKAMNPAEQIRISTINYSKYMRPSFMGKLNQTLSEGINGKLPPEYITEMRSNMKAMADESAGQYSKVRADFVRRHKARGENATQPTNIVYPGYTPPTADEKTPWDN